MERITAESLEGLLDLLRDVPDKVPPRGMGRRTEHTEPWVLKRLVASLAAGGWVEFPLTIELDDRPDIVLESDGLKIGIELMELIPAAYAQAVAIANREFPKETIVDRSVFGWRTEWTPEGIREHLRTEGHRLSGDGWAGDAVEREWAEAVRNAVAKKTERLNASGFRLFTKNWLGTYASSPGPVFDVDVGASLLSSSDLRQPTYTMNFDGAVNLVSDSIVVVTEGGVSRCEHIRP